MKRTIMTWPERIVCVALCVTAMFVPIRANAEPEIPAATQTGQHDAGWLRVVCKTTTTDVRCNMRAPGGLRAMTTTYYHAGDRLAVGTSHPYTPHNTRAHDKFSARITDTVRVSCSISGARTTCAVKVPASVTRFVVTDWSAGVNYGSVVWTAN